MSPPVDQPHAWWEMAFDPSISDQWHLRGPRAASGEAFDHWQLRRGEPIESPPPLVVEVRYPGTALDWSLAAAATPILTARAAEVLASVAGDDVQLIPVAMQGASGEYFAVNVLNLLDAIDEDRTVGVRLPRDDPHRPGSWRRVRELVLRADVLDGHRMVLPVGWVIALCAADPVVEALRAHEITGIDYRRVAIS